MPTETWLVLTLAAEFLFIGVISSLVLWVSLDRRSRRLQTIVEQRSRDFAAKLRGLEQRVQKLEAARPPDRRSRARLHPGVLAARASGKGDSPSQPPLIAVPDLETAPSDREHAFSGLRERHASIWALADSGAAPDVIARTTGQPIGQIELVLGLRRKLGGTRTATPHSNHG